MEIEVFGGVAVLLGLLSLSASQRVTIFCAVVITVFTATAGVIISGAPIVAPYIFMLFVFASFLTRLGLGKLIEALFGTSAGFTFTLFVVFSLLTAYVCPRLFEGSTEVFWSAHGEFKGAQAVILYSLAPGGGNITQSIYMIGALLSFGLMFGMILEKSGPKYFISAMIALAIFDIISAVIDVGTYLTGTGYLLEFIHNSYAILNEASLAGFKRIVGFFPEASAFGSFNVCLFAFLLSLFSSRVMREITGPLCAIVFVLILLCTSTSAYVALALYMALFGRSMVLGVIKASPAAAIVSILGGSIGVILIAMYLVSSGAISDVSYLLDLVFFEKAGSDSGLERGSWNTQAWDNFVETFGMGAGLGSARASSLPLVFLSNVGIFGSTFYVIFLNKLLRAPIVATEDPLVVPLGWACRHAMIGALISGCISGTVMDLGILYSFLAAGAAAAVTLSERAQRRGRSENGAIRANGVGSTSFA